MNTGDLKSSGDLPPPPPIPDLVFIRTPRGGVPGRLVRVRPRRHALAQRPAVDGRAAAGVRTPAGPRVLVGSGFAAGNRRSTALRLYSDKPMNTGDLKSSGDVTRPPIPDLVFIRTPRGGVPGRLVRVRPRRHALAQRPGVDGRAAARVRTPAGPRVLVGSGFAAGNGRSTALRLYSDKPMNTGDLKSSGDVTPPPDSGSCIYPNTPWRCPGSPGSGPSAPPCSRAAPWRRWPRGCASSYTCWSSRTRRLRIRRRQRPVDGPAAVLG